MPKLWADTVEAHRGQVRTAVLDAVEELVASRGLLGVTMSNLAASTGIGRATLYKYFAEIDDVLRAWHHRHVAGHLAALQDLADRPGEPTATLRRVLEGYGRICQGRRQHGAEALVAALHHEDQISSPEQSLRTLLSDLLTKAAAAGAVRSDVPAEELARYCLHAMTAAADAGTDAAIVRLVDVALAGLAPPASSVRV